MRRWHDLGYIASLITFCGASIFWISTITGVPGVLPNEATHIAEWDILFWFPQARPFIRLYAPTLAASGGKLPWYTSLVPCRYASPVCKYIR